MAIEEVSEKLRSMAAGFSEGPIIGGLNAIAIGLGVVREGLQDTVNHFRTLSIEAMKAGVSTQFMERLAGMAQTVGVGIEQVGSSFKILEERGVQAQEGSKEAQQAFERLGISSQQLAELLKSPQQLFEKVQESIGSMGSAAERQAAALQLFGRAGAQMVPVLSMSKAEIDALGETLEKLKGHTDDATINAAKNVGLLESFVEAGMEGITTTLSKPILEYLNQHFDQLKDLAISTFATIRNAITTAWGAIEAAWPTIKGALEGMAVAFAGAATAIGLVTVLNVPLMMGAIGGALSLVAAALAALVGALASPIVLLAALGAGMGILYEHSTTVRHALNEVGTLLEALVIVAFEKTAAAAKDVWEWLVKLTDGFGSKLKSAMDDAASSPIGTFLQGIHNWLSRILDMLGGIIDKTAEAINKIEQLAGVQDKPGDLGPTRGLSRDEAARRLGGDGSHKEAGGGDEQPKAAGDHPSASPQVTATQQAAKTQTASANALDQSAAIQTTVIAPDNSATIQAAVTAAVATTAAASSNPNASAVTSASITPPPAPSKPKPGYSTVRGELTDAVPDDQGLYHVRSASGGGMGGTLTKDQYDNLRASDKSSRGTDHHTMAAPDDKLDSISLWRRSHDEQMDSISERVGRSRPGGGGGSSGPPNYYVTVNQTANPQQTASELAAKLLPALQKAQKDHDQRAAGAVSAAAVASSMGGGSG